MELSIGYLPVSVTINNALLARKELFVSKRGLICVLGVFGVKIDIFLCNGELCVLVQRVGDVWHFLFPFYIMNQVRFNVALLSLIHI